MEMSNEPSDRLSELPDSLIFNIFEFLPMNDVVRTQILSHRWENLWTITPHLYFDAHGFGNLDQFRNFVNRSLLRWRGKKIQKFKVNSISLNKSLFSDIDSWVRFAVDNGAEELDSFYCNKSFYPCYDDYRVPKCLYSCSSLKKLSLFGSIIEINGNGVQCNELKSLELQCYGITQHAIDLLLSKCPVLEVFILSFKDKDNNLSLSFRSNSLKELLVCKRSKNLLSRDDDISMSELRIWTPNLVKLSFHGVTYGKCLLMNVSSLSHATFYFCENDCLGVTLSQILPTIQHVEGLTLSHYCIKVLGAMTSNLLLSPISSVMFLKLDGSLEEHEQIVGLLEIFPKLKKLVINESSIYMDPKRTKSKKSNKSKKNRKKKFKPNPSESFLVELRTVEITWTMNGFLIFPLIEILLKYASNLEKMVFQVRQDMLRYYPSNTLSLASQKLLKMPRSSPNANFIFGEC